MLRIGLVNGPLGEGTVVGAAPDGVVLRCRFGAAPEPEPAVDLVLALPRPKQMKRLWTTLAMMGVRRLVLVNANKVERTYFSTHWLEPDHYEPLLIEGLEQAGMTRMPSVMIRKRLKPFVEHEVDELFDGQDRWLAHPGDTASRLSGARGVCDRGIAVAVGPEGGWTDYELGLLRTHGFVPVSLGPRRFRSDAACVALLTLAASMMRESGRGLAVGTESGRPRGG